jgi:hypothetical protein
MALTAEDVGFLKTYPFAVGHAELVPIIGIVTVEAPPAGHVLKHNVLVHFELSWLPVHRHALMALRAREDAGRKGRRGDKEFLRDFLLFSEEIRSRYYDAQENHKREKQSGLFSIHIVSPFFVWIPNTGYPVGESERGAYRELRNSLEMSVRPPSINGGLPALKEFILLCIVNSPGRQCNIKF